MQIPIDVLRNLDQKLNTIVKILDRIVPDMETKYTEEVAHIRDMAANGSQITKGAIYAHEKGKNKQKDSTSGK